MLVFEVLMGKTATSLAFAVFSFIALDAGVARAQAWVGDKGALDVGLDYNLAISDKVVLDKTVSVGTFNGDSFKDAGVLSHQLTLSAEYVPLRHLAVNVQLPFLALKYRGELGPDGRPVTVDGIPYDHANAGSYDDGDYHGTLTDLRVGARYQVLEDPVAFSPHIGVSIPLADYETIGNAVAGRHLKMLHVGASLGYLIGDTGYTQLLYEFTLAEKYKVDAADDPNGDVKKHGQNRSDFAFTIGRKFLGYKLDLHADANLRLTHGGVNFSDFFSAMPLSGAESAYHDAILRETVLLVGGGIGYQVSNSVALNLSARYFATGANTINASILAFGVAWSPIQ